MPEPVVIATWPFGKTAVEVASKLLAAGKVPLDAAIAGAQAVEDDPSVHSVGYGGIGNAIGTVALDACCMDGKTLDCGSVAGVENIRHVAALSKKVYEKTPHVMLVGKGAEWFAIQNGFPLETLLTPEAVALWEKDRPKKKGHDTVTVLANDGKGRLGGVCTTSGLSYKTPGRVGDSPIIGAGLYVDDEAGAAGATGVGEEIIRIGGALFIVEQMRAGKSPQEACELAVKRHIAAAVRRGQHPAQVAFLALNPKGDVGAACTERTNFKYAVARGEKVEMLQAREL
ncbi:MAG TPA: isoaspartyl peptidase/L-asparaginase [Gemmataceae bacterium]|jgi:isoaspartyl peptidase/L-asparaginase-like protein (Ntn-hydrolase superfamily)|nr:isoaspartyl peptidase/L-asparaginase [Gemmataceae bacterium]